MTAANFESKVSAAARKEITWFRDAARLPENHGNFTFLADTIVDRLAERMRVPAHRIRPIVESVIEADEDVTVAWTKFNGKAVYRISAKASR